MALNLKDVNIARESMGLAPLEKLPTESAQTTETENKPETVITPEVENPEKKTTETKIESPVGELTDEQLMEILSKRGITAASLEDLKPKEAQKSDAELAEEKESAKLTFGLTKGLFKRSEYESFIADNNAKENLVFAHYSAEAKKEDPELTDDEIVSEFQEKYGLTAESGSRKHKRGAQEINLIASEILKAKYAKIFDAENKYSTYEQNQQSQLAYKKDIQAKTPEYTKNIKDAFLAAKKIGEVELPAEKLSELEAKFLSPELIEKNLNLGFSKEQIAAMVRTAVITENFDTILEKHSNAKLLAHQAGTKGIVLPSDARKEVVDNNIDSKLTPEQKKMRDEYVAEQSKTSASQN